MEGREKSSMAKSCDFKGIGVGELNRPTQGRRLVAKPFKIESDIVFQETASVEFGLSKTQPKADFVFQETASVQFGLPPKTQPKADFVFQETASVELGVPKTQVRRNKCESRSSSSSRNNEERRESNCLEEEFMHAQFQKLPSDYEDKSRETNSKVLSKKKVLKETSSNNKVKKRNPSSSPRQVFGNHVLWCMG